MKFITEEYLRDLHKKEPFTTYKLKQGERLTPGASQFLSDRRIKLLDHDELAEEMKDSFENKPDWKKKKLLSKLKTVESLFFIASTEIINKDVIIAQRIIILSKKISSIIKNISEEKFSADNHSFNHCFKMNSDNCCDNLGDCFEINEFHLQLQNNKEIMLLNNLRCSLSEIEIVALELYGETNKELSNNIIREINLAINSLSQMICTQVGGKECQRII